MTEQPDIDFNPYSDLSFWLQRDWDLFVRYPFEEMHYCCKQEVQWTIWQ